MISIKILDLIIKGGAGSGNFGHAGRPGFRGGSSSKVVALIPPVKPSLSDFINIYKVEKLGVKTEKPILNSLNDLKPPKKGFIRFLHGTSLSNLSSIDKNGVLTGAEVGSKEHLKEVLGYNEFEYRTQGDNVFGEITVIADVPQDEISRPNSGWLSINRAIKPSEIKGYLVGKITVSPSELMPIILEYNKRYQE